MSARALDGLSRWLAYGACAFAAAGVAVTWLLAALLNDVATYGADPSQTSARFPLPTPLSALLGLVLVCAAALACSLPLTRERRPGRPALSLGEFAIVAVALTCVVWAAQVVFVRALYFEPGWDAGTMLEYARWKVSGFSEQRFFGAKGNAWVTGYLALYPNNAPLTLAFTWLYRAAGAWGVDGTFLCALVGAFSVGLAGLAATLAVRLLTGSAPVALVALGTYTALFSLSPWACVPYSDTYASAFVGAGLLLGVALARRPPAGAPARTGLWFALGLACLLGYLVKPTVALVLPATALACLLRPLARGARLREALSCALGVACAALVALALVRPAAYAALGVEQGPSTALGLAHFLMMGQNDATTGSYLQADVDWSRSIADPDERSRAELAAALSRALGRSPLESLWFYARKALYSFADGTFSWGVEGGSSFVAYMKPGWGALSGALRSAYYPSDVAGGGDPSAFRAAAQVVWFATLALVAAGGVLLAASLRPRRGAGRARRAGLDAAASGRDLVSPCAPLASPRDPAFPLPRPGATPRHAALVPLLALAALALYLLVFECRARYLYCYGPVVVACAGFGLAELARRLAPLMRYHDDTRLRPARVPTPGAAGPASHQREGTSHGI